MRLLSCIKIAPIHILDASHSISKVLVKSGKSKTSTKHKLSFNNLKASLCSLHHLKPIEFFTILVNGVARVFKSLTKHL